jgi:hypothetical protein
MFHNVRSDDLHENIVAKILLSFNGRISIIILRIFKEYFLMLSDKAAFGQKWVTENSHG